MKKVLISSFDMEIGGVERSLISMLDNFDYENYEVDLMLYSHSGDLMKLLPKKISSFDMEIGGVERSLISMLDNFDYENYEVDLMLYSHSGDLMKLLPKKPNLLAEDKKYKTFRLSIGESIKRGNFSIFMSRLFSII